MRHSNRKKELQIEAIYCVVLIVALISILVRVPAHELKMDDRIVSTARESYVLKTYLLGEDIKIRSKDGAVTLTGIVANDFNKSLAQETVADLPGVKSVDNRLEVKGEPLTANLDVGVKNITNVLYSSGK